MKLCYQLGIAGAVFVLASISAYPAERAILRNGFAIRYERREPRNTDIRLYLTATLNDYIDVPAGEIVGYEKIDLPAAQVPSSVPASDLDEVISAASIRNKIDRDLVISLIRAESGFNTEALSPKGAQGLMQLMPQTAGRLGVKDPMDPASNVEGGTRYLRELLDLFNNDLVRALAAYNAGPQRVAQYRGVPPYPETRTYVARILSDFNRKKVARKDQNKKRDLL
jgi:soluble lytic murein transglycosylase-like protein